MKHFYLAGGHRGLYPGYPKADTSHIILTESIIDAATLISTAALQDGSCVLALYGTNGWTEAHTEAIGQLHDLKEITLFFDGDEAGSKGVMKYGQLIKETYPGMKIATVTVPQGEDANSLLDAHDTGILTHLIEKKMEHLFSPEKATQ